MGLGNLPRESLTQLVSALAMLGHKDVVTDVFLSAASDEISKDIDNFSGPQLSDILWSYTLVGHAWHTPVHNTPGFSLCSKQDCRK